MAKPNLHAPDDGIPRRAYSGQIYGTVPDRATALQIASQYEFVSAQAAAGSEQLNGFAAQMLDSTQTVTVGGVTYRGKASLIITTYDKLVVETVSGLPSYMHTTPLAQMTGGPLAQPQRTGTPAVSGYNEWGAYHANVMSKPALDAANALYASNPYRGSWQDSAGPATLKGQQWWSGSGHTAGTAISPLQWVNQEISVLDELAVVLGPDAFLGVSGIRPDLTTAESNGSFFLLMDHADIGLWDNWGNGGGTLGSWCSQTTASTARPSDAQWQAMCKTLLDAQGLGRNMQVQNGFAAASVSAGGTALRAAQEFLVGTLLLGSNGSNGGGVLMEVTLGGTGQTPPWTNGEMLNPLYDAFVTSGGASVLGPPLDFYTDVATAQVASSTVGGGLYQRKYTNGYVLVNTAPNALTSSLDGRSYTDLFTGAAVGSSVTVPAGTAKFLKTTAVTASSPFVKVHDSQAATGTATTLVLTVGSTIPVGNTVILVVGGAHSSITSITDNKGNTYTRDVQDSASSAAVNAVFSGPVTTQLVAGDTWTITYGPAVGGRSAIAAEYAGTLIADAPTANAANGGTALTATSATVNTAAATAQAAEVLIVGLTLGGSGGPSGVPSVAGAYTQRATIEQASGTQRRVALADRTLSSILASPGVTYSWPNPTDYELTIVAYKLGSSQQVDTTPPVVTITTPSTASFTATPGATTQQIAGTITDDVSPDHVVVTNTSTGQSVTDTTISAAGAWSVAIPIDPTQPSGSNSIKVVGFDSTGNPSTAKFRTIIASTSSGGGGGGIGAGDPLITLLSPAEVLPKPPSRGMVAPNRSSPPAGYDITAISVITCYLDWADLQTTNGGAIGGAGLTKINTYLNWAQANGGFVKFRIFTNGSYQTQKDGGAPTWLKSLVGTVQHLNGQDQDPSVEPALVLARYWRPEAITAYENLMGPLATLLDNNPYAADVSMTSGMLLYAEPLIISLSDPENRAELVGGGLGWGPGTPANSNENQVAVPGAGYTDAAQMSTMQQGIDIHAKYFKNTDTAIVLNPYQILLSKAEATAQGKTNTYTNNDQFFDSSDDATLSHTKALIDYAINSLGDRALLENHSARPDYFTYDGAGNASAIDLSQNYGQMYDYMVSKGGPLFIQTANSNQIANTTYPDVGVAFAKTMDGVQNLLLATGVEPPLDFSAQFASGKTQFSPANFTAYTTNLRSNPTRRGITNSATISIPSTQTSYTVVVDVLGVAANIATVTINGVAATIVGGHYQATITGISAGSHDYPIIATDQAGNTSQATATIIRGAAATDLTPPALTALLTPPGGGADIADDVLYPSGTTSVTIRGTAADEAGGSGLATVTVGGTSVAVAADGSWSRAVAVSANSNPIHVVATDHAGNQRTLTRTATVSSTHQPPSLRMTSPVTDESVANSQSSELVTGSVILGDGTLGTVKVNGVTILSGGGGGGGSSYTGRFGSDHGGGYANIMAVDPLNAGGMAAGGDTWGQRLTQDGGNTWIACEKGRTSHDQSRAAAFSLRPTTSGVCFWGTGNFQSPGAGNLAYVLPGDNQPHDIDTTNGFGGPWGGGGAGTGIASAAKRACGDMIVCDYDAAADKQYIYTITNTGLHRYVDGGASAAAITGPTTLLTPGQLGNMPQYVSLCSFDANHLLVIAYDQSADQVWVNTKMWIVTSSGSTNGLRNATSGQCSAVQQTVPVPHVYEVHQGQDNHYYAACAYDGVYEVTLSGNTLSWTDIMHSFNEVVVASVDAAPDRTIWVTQAGGNATTHTFKNDSTGTPAAHAIIKGTRSGTSWTWSYPLATATVGGKVFRSGDGVLATGDLWYLNGRNVMIDQAAYDGAMIRVDPFNPSKITSTGRSGSWQTRDNGVHWNPAMRGQNGTQVLNGVVTNNSGTSHGAASDDVSDWGGLKTTDHWNTVTVNASGQVAGGRGSASLPGGSAAGGTATFVGDDGNTYVFTAAHGGTPASVTKKVGSNAPVEIGDEGFKGCYVHPAAMAVDSDGTVYMAQYGGGIYVLEHGTVQTTGFTTSIPLSVGANQLTVIATDSNGLTTEFDAVIERAGVIGDTQAPTLSYNSPINPATLAASIPNSQTSIVIAGTATDDSGTVSSLTIGGVSVAVGAGGAFTHTFTGLPVGTTTYQVVATDPSGNTYSRTLSVTRSSSVTPPVVQITTQDPTNVGNAVSSVAIAGVASAPGATVASVAAWAGNGSHITAALGATNPPQAVMGVYLGDQSTAVGSQAFAGGLASFEAMIGRPVGLQAYLVPWDFTTATADSIAVDIAAGRQAMIRWVPPAATALSPAQQIANGSQDSVITAKINMLAPLGGRIYLAWGINHDNGNFGTAAEVVAALQRIYSMFTSAGATNVKHIWAADALRLSAGTSTPYYPGDASTDYVGASGLFGPLEAAPNNVYPGVANLYDGVVSFATAHGKQVFVHSIGVAEQPAGSIFTKVDFFNQFDAYFQVHPQMIGWVWFEGVTGAGSDLRVETTPASLSGFSSMSRDVIFLTTRSWTATVTGLVAGANTVQAQATDSAGQTSSLDTITVNRQAVAGVPAAQSPSPVLIDETVSGRFRVGDILNVTSGGWTNGPTSYLFQWYRGNSTTPFRTNSGGGNNDTYTIGSADAGSTLRVTVTATNSTGPSLPASTATSPIVTGSAPPGVPVLQTAVTVTDVG